MKLSLEQIRNITVGVVDIWKEADGVHFAKCTKKQKEAWHKLRPEIGEYSESTTGIRLDFHTDSKFFTFTPTQEGRYEIYLDEVMRYCFCEEDFVRDLKKTIELDGQEHRITLYLPAHSIGILESVEIDDNASIKSHKFDCKILFIGDSITQGWDSTWDSLSYAQRTSRFFNAESVIQGIGGAVFHESLFDVNLDFDPDIVVVAYGTNDWEFYATKEEGETHCKEFLKQLMKKYGNKMVFGISPIWRKDEDKNISMGKFEVCTSYVKSNIISHGLNLIDGATLTPHQEDFYCDRFLHPNTSGFENYALNLIQQMQNYLNNKI